MTQVQGEQSPPTPSTNTLSARGAGGENANRNATEAGRSFADAASQAGKGAAKANAEVLRTTLENTNEAVQAGLRSAETALQTCAETVSQALGLGDQKALELARVSARNLQSMSDATARLTQGAQEVSRTWTGLASTGWKAQVDAFGRLAACRSAPDLLAVQSELWRENLQRSIDAGQTVARASLRAIEEADRALRAAASPAPG